MSFINDIFGGSPTPPERSAGETTLLGIAEKARDTAGSFQQGATDAFDRAMDTSRAEARGRGRGNIDAQIGTGAPQFDPNNTSASPLRQMVARAGAIHKLSMAGGMNAKGEGLTSLMQIAQRGGAYFGATAAGASEAAAAGNDLIAARMRSEQNKSASYANALGALLSPMAGVAIQGATTAYDQHVIGGPDKFNANMQPYADAAMASIPAVQPIGGDGY